MRDDDLDDFEAGLAHLCLVLSKPGIVKGALWRLRFDLLVLIKQTIPEQEIKINFWEVL